MQERILIAPLDWGMGHVSRCKQIVQACENKQVILAIPKSYQSYFSNYNVTFEFVKGYNIKYFRNISVQMSLLLQVFKIIYIFFYEKIVANRLAKKYNVDYIISDNRPFFRASSCINIYVTHQVTILNGKQRKNQLISYFHQLIINKFNTCWIPDTKNHDIAGELSKGRLRTTTHFIGGLSRFYFTKIGNIMQKFDSVCILAGPMPGRMVFLEKIRKLWTDEHNALIIGAIGGVNEFKKVNGLTLSSHLTDNVFAEVLINANVIISKAGYSTIMDLLLLQKSAVIIPQKGQSEQEYLSKLHCDREIDINHVTNEMNFINNCGTNINELFYLNSSSVNNYL